MNIVKVATTSLLLALATQSLAQSENLIIGTGGEAGVYFPTGRAICAAFEANRNASPIDCEISSTAGSVANINGVRDGSFSFGIAQSDTLPMAFMAEGHFHESAPYRDIRVLMSLHPEPIQVLVRKDANINSVSDLAGKFVSVGAKGSGTRVISEALLSSAGLSTADLALAAEMDMAGQSNALCDRRLDAVIMVAGLPNALAMQTTMNCDVAILDLRSESSDAFLAQNRAYSYVTIPAGTYRGNPYDVVTWGPRAVLIADANMSSSIVADMVRAIRESLADIKSSHPALTYLEWDEMRSLGISAPVHEGAAKLLFDLN